MQVYKRKSHELPEISQLISDLKKYGQLALRDISSIILQISSLLSFT